MNLDAKCKSELVFFQANDYEQHEELLVHQQKVGNLGDMRTDFEKKANVSVSLNFFNAIDNNSTLS